MWIVNLKLIFDLASSCRLTADSRFLLLLDGRGLWGAVRGVSLPFHRNSPEYFRVMM